MNPLTTGERVAEIRIDVGLTQTELGQLAGLRSPSHVGLIERGERPNVQARTVTAIARVLGTTAEYLVDGVGERPSKAAALAAANAARARNKVPTRDEATGPRVDRTGDYSQVAVG